MKNIKIVVSPQKVKIVDHPLTVFFIDEHGHSPSMLSEEYRNEIESITKLDDFKGKKSENVTVYYHDLDKNSPGIMKRILFVGLGKTENVSENVLRENLRCAGGKVARSAEQYKANSINVVLPDYLKQSLEIVAESIVEGIILGNYQFKKYKNQEKKDIYSGITKILVTINQNNTGIRKAVKKGKISAIAANKARDMANEPGNRWTPQSFADFAKKMADETSLTCKILNIAQIAKEGMGGIIAVNQGTAVPPKLVILDHKPQKYSKTILLVGKGLTFDSGGISIKPALGMQDMKYDMCGGAAVLSAMICVAEEKPEVRVIAVVPATENLSGSKAVKPGDIITHYNGVTSEVINTDAEGRLILADALSYGIKKYKPDCVVDLATLTGAVVVALGHHRTGLMSNNDTLADFISESGDICGEPVWRLPLDEEYRKQIESDVADIKNIGGKEGGSITAAAYLEKFVGDTPWVHLDIAGTAWDFTKKEYIPKGPSGIGVRTLITFIRNWNSLELK